MAMPICEQIVNGAKCGGVIADGFCNDCGAMVDLTLLPSVAVAVAKNTNSARSSAKIGGSSLRSSRRSVRFIGKPAAQAQGLLNKKRLGGASSQTSSSKRRNLGGGFVAVSEVPQTDPLHLIKTKWDVPVEQRFCDDPTGKRHPGVRVPLTRRDKDGNLADSGVCTKCGSPYSYAMLPGTIVANQYEVKGTIAKGGCGYIYLCWDLDVERWAIVKGVITNNKMDREAAIAEKQMLAKLSHPSVVQIFGFKTHQNQPLIAMQLVDGKTVEQIYEDNNEPLPVAQSIAYVLGMCQSIGFLHEQKPKVFNPDIKPGNFMVTGNRMVMIDAGGCVLATNLMPNVTSTKGYAPREVDDESVDLILSEQSDLYSLGRVLAVLSNVFDFEEMYRYSLPDDLENFDKYPSYAAIIRRATAPDPLDRFSSVAEFEAQLWGVLREVVAIDTGATKPLESEFFDGDISNGSPEANWRLLPGLKIDMDDSARGEVETALKAATAASELKPVLVALADKHPKSREARFRLAHCLIQLDEHNEAEGLLNTLAESEPDDWKTVWLRGLLALAKGDHNRAVEFYSSVVVQLPGEPAAKLALGFASELVGDTSTAIGCCDLVTLVDADRFAMAAFVHSRSLALEGNRASAVKALKRVPSSSIAHVPAEMQAARVLIETLPSSKPGKDELVAAAGIIAGVMQDNLDWHRLAADLYLAGTRAVESGDVAADAQIKLMGVKLKSYDLRTAANLHLSICASHTSGDERNSLIAEALKAGPFKYI
ncbi:MAG: tetratricopeptide repeat protein [Candidatus Obscuribacterales bacterium]|nr:tetratricopeptide repeat protein [Candidatus Obscuribacterales bacterium]